MKRPYSWASDSHHTLHKKVLEKDITCAKTTEAKWVKVLALSHPYIQRAQIRVGNVEFNKAYILEQNPTNTRRVYISVKQD